MERKVLIITYYWPPAGGPGVQRWLKFVKYLPKNNIEPILFIPKNPNYPTYDYSLNDEVSDQLKIIRHPITEISNFFPKYKSINSIRSGNISKPSKQSLFEKLLFFIRGNFVIPDMKVFWRNSSVKFLEKYLIENDIDTIITTGPPHSLHLIGLDLKNKINIKWIADFRDPWVNLNYLNRFHLFSSVKNFHKKLRNKVLNGADAVTVTSEKLKVLFDSISKDNFKISNGFDYNNSGRVLDVKFTISHIGSIYPDRNPELLWQVLEKLCLDIKDFKKDLKLNFIGNVDDKFKSYVKDQYIFDNVTYFGYLENFKALNYLCSSQLLLMIEVDDNESSYAIPAKFFDYINSNRPIISFGPINSEISKILMDTNTGKSFVYNEFENVYNYILEIYSKYKNESNIIFSKGVEEYSREKLTKELSNIIDSVNKKKPYNFKKI